MRISDWSSDVCSSDLLDQGTHGPRLCRVEIGRVERPRARSAAMIPVPPAIQRIPWKLIAILAGITGFGLLVLYSAAGGNWSPWAWQQGVRFLIFLGMALVIGRFPLRSDERRVGKECVSTVRSRCETPH